MTVLVVAWVLTLLSIFSLGFNHEARTELSLSRLDVETVQARSLARSGITVASELARQAVANEATALGEPWNTSPELRRVDLGAGSFSIGAPDSSAPDGRGVTYGLIDEGRRLPLALATREMLERLPGMDASTVDALLQYRESARWEGFPPLAEHPGIASRLRPSLARWLTLYPGGGVNINTAPRAIFEALGIPAQAVDRILARRIGPDGEVGTSDDAPFTTLLSPEGGLEELSLGPEEAAVISILAREEILVTRSTVFRARTRGWVEGSRRYCEIDAVIRVTSAGTEFLDWRERWKS